MHQQFAIHSGWKYLSFFSLQPLPILPLMIGKTIYLKEVLEQMRTLDSEGRAVPFSVAVRTYQRFSSTGGKLSTYEKAKMVLKEENPNVDSILSLRQKPKQRTVLKRNPNHYDNKTRNIKILPGGSIKKIHIRCIVKFNGLNVIY